MKSDAGGEGANSGPSLRPREPVCSHCSHGRDLHDGPAEAERPGGWCRACDDYAGDHRLIPYCWSFSE